MSTEAFGWCMMWTIRLISPGTMTNLSIRMTADSCILRRKGQCAGTSQEAWVITAAGLAADGKGTILTSTRMTLGMRVCSRHGNKSVTACWDHSWGGISGIYSFGYTNPPLTWFLIELEDFFFINVDQTLVISEAFSYLVDLCQYKKFKICMETWFWRDPRP